MTKAYRILVIDDDAELTALLVEYLEPEGFQVEIACNAETGLERIAAFPYDLILLDVMLPGLNGFEALRRIRGQSQVPVMMLTARGEEMDRIIGLEIGADDYLPKPFHMRELTARAHSILRRTKESGTSHGRRLRVGDVQLDERARVVLRNGLPVELTTVEFDLLRALVESRGQIVSRERLIETVLGRPFSVFDRSIDNHVSSLRRKLGRGHLNMERIRTIRGEGYLYADPVGLVD
ncbi:MAG: response regulator transcription factor [Bryobacteraceae bacterium]|nr:response regulator transcription factor [Bryobacteraceae bacterium]